MRNTPAMYGGLVQMCQAIRNRFPHDPLVVVEVGAYAGEGSEILLQHISNCSLHCIDPWKSGYDANDPASHTNMEMVEKRFDRWAATATGVHKHKGVSVDFSSLPQFQKVDVVYIDGAHTHKDTLHDILFWLPRTTKAICGHDYGFSHDHWLGGVTKAVHETLGTPDVVCADSSWIKWV